MTEQTADDARRSPLTVVTRRAVAGRGRAVERWHVELAQAARRAPGFVGLQLTRPDDRDPDRWSVVYRFASAEALDAWLASPERTELVEAGAELWAAPPREQRLAVAVVAEAVTAVTSVRLRPGAEEEHRRRYDDVVDALTGFPGFLRAELFEPVPGVQDETVVVFSFASRGDLDRWLSSAERAELLAAVDELTEGDRTTSVVGGFAGWFARDPQRPVRRWKQAAVVLLALYPTALVLGAVTRVVAPSLPWPVATLVGNAAGVAALTWIVMPPLTRALDGWLRR